MDKELYWDAGSPPDELMQWVSDNCLEAVKQSWHPSNVNHFITEDQEGNLVFLIEDKFANENYSMEYNLFAELKAYAEIGPFHDKEAALDTAKQMEKLADLASFLAEKAKFDAEMIED